MTVPRIEEVFSDVVFSDADKQNESVLYLLRSVTRNKVAQIRNPVVTADSIQSALEQLPIGHGTIRRVMDRYHARIAVGDAVGAMRQAMADAQGLLKLLGAKDAKTTRIHKDYPSASQDASPPPGLHGLDPALVGMVALNVSSFARHYQIATDTNDLRTLHALGDVLVDLSDGLRAKDDLRRLKEIVRELRRAIKELKAERQYNLDSLKAKSPSDESFISTFTKSYAAKLGEVGAMGTVALATAVMISVVPGVIGVVTQAAGPADAKVVQDCLMTYVDLAQQATSNRI